MVFYTYIVYLKAYETEYTASIDINVSSLLFYLLKENLGHQMPRLIRELGDRGLLRSRERTISSRSTDTSCPSDFGDGDY